MILVYACLKLLDFSFRFIQLDLYLIEFLRPLFGLVKCCIALSFRFPYLFLHTSNFSLNVNHLARIRRYTSDCDSASCA